MCRVLGQDFIPYLPGVVPPLLELAAAKADIQLLDDEEQAAQMDAEEGWELIPVKGKYIGIKTSILDDKHTATELIVIYAQHLEAAFEPYVVNIMDTIAIPGLSFFFHDPVRVAAAKAVPQLLNSYKKAHGDNSPQLQGLWERTIDKVLEVLKQEPAIDTLAEMYQCFYESVEVMGRSCLGAHHMENFIESARSVLEDYQLRVKERAEDAETNAVDGDDYDADEDELIAIDDDQTLLANMNKAFHAITKHETAAFLPHWEKLLPYYAAFIAAADPTQRQWALCIFDDILEFCPGDASWPYHAHIIQPLVAGMSDAVPANRQAAVYGAGVAAHKGGAPWADFAANCLPLLFAACAVPNARSDDDVYATENACASIAKILHFARQRVANAQEATVAWVDTLPIVNDEEAAPYAYSFLASLVDQ